MYYVYVIKSINHDFLYIGVTHGLRERFNQHNAGQSLATKAYVPFKLIYYEAYDSKQIALKREYALKHHGGTIAALRKRLNL